MIVLILLLLAVLLIRSAFFLEKNVKDRVKIATKFKAISAIVVFCSCVLFVTEPFLFDGSRVFYTFPEDKHITVWKCRDQECYLIFGKYCSMKKPSDDYIKFTSMSVDFADIIYVEGGKIIVNIEEGVKCQSFSGSIRLYSEDKSLNDSIYTYLNGKYRCYKTDVEYVSLNIRENYATSRGRIERGTWANNISDVLFSKNN